MLINFPNSWEVIVVEAVLLTVLDWVVVTVDESVDEPELLWEDVIVDEADVVIVIDAELEAVEVAVLTRVDVAVVVTVVVTLELIDVVAVVVAVDTEQACKSPCSKSVSILLRLSVAA
jgi:hypothetical protein